MYNGQILQDAFVDGILNINFGFFLDIGAGTGGLRGNPINFYSNTYFLEAKRNWQGIAIDYDKNYIDFAKTQRNCHCICADLMQININDILKNLKAPSVIDYLSFDVDDATDKVFEELDFNEYKFKVITFEHNIFQASVNSNCPENHKTKVKKLYEYSRLKFKSLGYHLICSDVVLSDYGPLEDWYIHPDFFDKNEKLISFVGLNCNDIIKHFNRNF